MQKYRLHLRKLNQTLHKDDTPSPSSHPNESNILRTEFNSSLNSTYFDQDGCLEITDYSLPKDDISSGSDCMLGRTKQLLTHLKVSRISDGIQRNRDLKRRIYGISSQMSDSITINMHHTTKHN